ncbi:hypothetical protein ACTA71_001937 [Dictyostelium dimigraforme]
MLLCKWNISSGNILDWWCKNNENNTKRQTHGKSISTTIIERCNRTNQQRFNNINNIPLLDSTSTTTAVKVYRNNNSKNNFNKDFKIDYYKPTLKTTPGSRKV